MQYCEFQGATNLLWVHDLRWVHVILMISNEFRSRGKELIPSARTQEIIFPFELLRESDLPRFCTEF